MARPPYRPRRDDADDGARAPSPRRRTRGPAGASGSRQTGVGRQTGAGRQTQARRRRPVRRQTEESDSGMTWLVFFLIFVVGNIILVATTGYVIIPK